MLENFIRTIEDRIEENKLEIEHSLNEIPDWYLIIKRAEENLVLNQLINYLDNQRQPEEDNRYYKDLTKIRTEDDLPF